jgi:hypothetical protein
LNYEDESFVKVYKRQTLGSKFLGWDGRAVLRALFLHVDRAGVLDLDDVGPAEAIAALEEIPIEIAAAGMAKLVARGTVIVTGNVLFIPNFMLAQEAKQSDAQRQRESRAARAAKARATALGLPVTKRDEPQMPRGGPPHLEPEDAGDDRPSGAQPVTKRDQSSPHASRNVTDCSPTAGAGHSRSEQTDQKDLTPSIQGPDRSTRDAPALVVVGAVPGTLNLQTRATPWVEDVTRATLVSPHPEKWPETAFLVATLAEVFGGPEQSPRHAGDPRMRAVLALWAEGRTMFELEQAIRGAGKDPHYRANPQFQTLQTILKDSAQVDKFIRLLTVEPVAQTAAPRSKGPLQPNHGKTGTENARRL